MKQQESVFTATIPAFTTDLLLTVGQLNRMAGRLLQETFGSIRVVGELSNVTQAASGHWYFTLKEGGAAVRAVMFRSAARSMDFQPKAGDRVEVQARVGLYEARGDFQLTIECMQISGSGDVWQRFARLKEKLASEGLFDAARKQLLPPAVYTVGIISSLKAAALQDVLTTLRRRAPQLKVIVYPASVQGQQAPSDLLAALRAADTRQECDVLLMVRGGGSFEDLDAFNDEMLARCLAACSLPVVTGVGHESDFTICDFVADIRAPTPTAAAEMVSTDRREMLQWLHQRHEQLQRAMQRQLEWSGQRLDMAERLLVAPTHHLQLKDQHLNQLAQRLQRSMHACLSGERIRYLRAIDNLRTPSLAEAEFRLQHFRHRLQQAAQRQWQRATARLDGAETALGLISPLAVLKRGYALVRDNKGRLLGSVENVSTGQEVTVHLQDGRLETTVDLIVSNTSDG